MEHFVCSQKLSHSVVILSIQENLIYKICPRYVKVISKYKLYCSRYVFHQVSTKHFCCCQQQHWAYSSKDRKSGHSVHRTHILLNSVIEQNADLKKNIEPCSFDILKILCFWVYFWKPARELKPPIIRDTFQLFKIDQVGS